MIARHVKQWNFIWPSSGTMLPILILIFSLRSQLSLFLRPIGLRASMPLHALPINLPRLSSHISSALRKMVFSLFFGLPLPRSRYITRTLMLFKNALYGQLEDKSHGEAHGYRRQPLFN